ncbi:hypothetical protein [Streptomyces johnsoniae]|uniref:Uncharacterized protein n=1 Tax=Streptomyces johnsoniae TaxID=3075532 RepID=A0ABU2S0N1_9ACTN|nr:hypothetical protein [Streptomyces sp. DSM 41886]MDT0442246.1 hypothetical protein [Streptomyces sp. DSM 41886]
MSGRGEIFLGDLVRALAALRPADRATAGAVCELLGLAGPPAPHPPAVPGAGAHPADDRPAGPASGDEGAARWAAPPADADRPTPPVPAAAPAFSLTVTERGGPGPAERPSLPEPLSAAGQLSALSYEPPWTPGWARGVMFAVVATPVESTRVDQRVLVRKVSRHQAVRSVPRLRRPSTRQGVQLLIDHSPGMAPFTEDRDWLRSLVGGVAGRERVETLRFRGSPARGVVGTDPLAPQPHRPPTPGTPVVLVSDLGLLRPPFAGAAVAAAAEWTRFVDSVRHAGCPVVCLTPYPAERHPAPLRQRVTLIPFDRGLSVTVARQARKAGP